MRTCTHAVRTCIHAVRTCIHAVRTYIHTVRTCIRTFRVKWRLTNLAYQVATNFDTLLLRRGKMYSRNKDIRGCLGHLPVVLNYKCKNYKYEIKIQFTSIYPFCRPVASVVTMPVGVWCCRQETNGSTAILPAWPVESGRGRCVVKSEP